MQLPVYHSWAILVLIQFKWTTAVISSALIEATIGGVAGSAGALASYPLDFVKSQLQTEDGRRLYNGGIDAAFKIMKNSGVGPLALYRGAAVQVIGSAPEKSIKLGANNFYKMAIESQLGYLPLVGEILAGALAGLTQIIVTNPIEVVKVKMQTSKMTTSEVLDEVEGIPGMFEGADACVARDMIFSAILFPLYSHSSEFFQANVKTDDQFLLFLLNLSAGSVAAVPAAILATPADVVKTRIQGVPTGRGEGLDPGPNSAEWDNSLLAVGSKMVDNEGLSVLFSGWFERSVRSIPQLGVTLAVFDVLNSYASRQGWI